MLAFTHQLKVIFPLRVEITSGEEHLQTSQNIRALHMSKASQQLPVDPNFKIYRLRLFQYMIVINVIFI
jgi:hypothetical protein